MLTQNAGPLVTVIKKIMKSAGDALIPTATRDPQGSKDSPAPQVLAVLEMLNPSTAVIPKRFHVQPHSDSAAKSGGVFGASLELPVESVPQKKHLFSVLGVQDQSRMGDDCSASELPESKTQSVFYCQILLRA